MRVVLGQGAPLVIVFRILGVLLWSFVSMMLVLLAGETGNVVVLLVVVVVVLALSFGDRWRQS